MNCERARQLLDAYVDRELDQGSQQAIQGHLQGCPACATREHGRLALRNALRALPRPPAPLALRKAVRPSTAPHWAAALSRLQLRGWSALGWMTAVAAVAFVLGRQWTDLESLNDTVVARHVAALAVAPAADASVTSSDQHRVKPWLAGRVNFAPPVPDLEAHGFALTGARLERLGTHDAVAVTWRIRNHAIDLFVWRAETAEATPKRSERWRGFAVVSWSDGGLRYAAISDVDLTNLERFSAVVADQMNTR